MINNDPMSLPNSSTRHLWWMLLWKEWTEHKWNTLWMTFLCLLGVFLAKETSSAIAFMLIISLSGALFLATGVLAGERDEGLWQFVNTLPIQRWKLGLIRMLVSAGMVIVPLLVSGIVLLYFRPTLMSAPTDHGAGLLLFLSMGCCLSFYFWVTATSYGQPTPIRVGLLGIIVATCWFAIDLALGSYRTNHGITWLEKLSWMGPISWGSHASVPPVEPGIPFLFSQVIVLSVLLIGSVLGYAAPPRRKSRGFESHATPLQKSPHRSANTAIAWLQFRESLPLCAAGTFLVMLLSFVAAVLLAPASSITHMSRMMETTALVMGIPWVAMIAVGTFVPNLKNGLHTFWRSRPIDVPTWFWSKFWISAGLSIVSIHLPVMIVIGVTRKLAWDAPLASCVSYLLYPLIHLTVYSVGVLAACWIRQLVQAGSLTIALTVLTIGVPMLPNGSLNWLRHDHAREALSAFVLNGFPMTHVEGFLPFLLVMFVVTGTAAFLGSMVVQKDIRMRRS